VRPTGQNNCRLIKDLDFGSEDQVFGFKVIRLVD